MYSESVSSNSTGLKSNMDRFIVSVLATISGYGTV